MTVRRRVARPPILDDLSDHRGHVVVEASAGTGKTYTLEHLVVDLILRQGVPLDEILIVTFTEKAAGELEYRLRRKLQRLVDGTEPEASADAPSAWLIDDRARAHLAAALISFDRATISTIHAFCQRILFEQAFAHRRPLTQTVVDGRAAFERAFLATLRADLARDPEPKPWLEAWLEEASLDALFRLAYECLERGGQIAPEFQPDRLRRALEALARAPTAWRSVRPMLIRGGVRGDRLREAGERLERVLRATRQQEPPRVLRALAEAEDDLIAGLAETLRSASDRQPSLQHLVSALELVDRAVVPFRAAALQVVLPRVKARLEADKARRGELDFSDMLRLLDESLQGPKQKELVTLLRARYRVALIDEFQDTDEVQWRIFRRIFLDEGATGRLVVIGDPKQAIYGFRGADVATYVAARREIEVAGGRRVALSRSFRATPSLVGALDRLLDAQAQPPFFPGSIRYTDPVVAGRGDLACLLEKGRPGPAAVVLRPEVAEDSLGLRAKEATLAAIIAEEAERLLAGDEVLFQGPEGSPRALEAREIFVLTRSAREGQLVAAALKARGIPAALYKQEGLFQSRQAHDVRALLAAIANPHREGLALRAWHTPFFAIPLFQLPSCLDLPPAHPLVGRLLEWKSHADRRDYARLFASLLEDSGVVERLLFSDEGDRALTNYLHLFEILQAEADLGRPPIGELVHRLTAFIEGRARPVGEDGNIERLESDRDAVQVMTMHKAKGLEAEVVFLHGGLRDVPAEVHPFSGAEGRQLFVGKNPPDLARDDLREEMRRLLYVALTRARTRLYVPSFGEPGEGGLQALLEPHLERLIREPESGWDLWRREPSSAASAPTPAPDQERRARLSSWRPPAEALERPAEDPKVEALRRARWGPVVTSYSRMKAEGEVRLGEGLRAPGEGVLTALRKERSAGASSEAAAPSEDPRELARSTGRLERPGDLAPGAASGRFLHEVLERLDLGAARDAPSFEAWLDLPETRRLFDAGLERHRRRPEQRRHAAELVWRAMTSPLHLGPGGVLAGGLVSAHRVLREMEFLFPVPRDPRAGFVKGFVDVVLEHEGRVYVVDWKSDDLESYDRAALDEHVRESYLLQAEIYSIAAARFVGATTEDAYETSFGGLLYVFLRGLPEGHELDDPGTERSPVGQWFFRPTWRELLSASAQLAP